MNIFRKFEKPAGDFFLKILKYFVVHQSISPESIEHKKINNILLIIRHQMGDFLCATPMIRSIRKFYQNAKIILVTKSSTNYDQIFKHDNQLVDKVYYYESGFENFINLIKVLQENKIDLAIVPSTVVFSATNHLLAYYSKAKIRVGVNSINFQDNKVAYLLNIKNDFLWQSKNVHQIERNLDIIRQINIDPEVRNIKLKITPELSSYAEKFILDKFNDSLKPIVGFHPGAGKSSNVWSSENFAELAFKISTEFNVNIFISEGPSDKVYIDEMTFYLKNKYGEKKYAIHKGALLNNLAIISKLKLFITNDTGIMHLASGVEHLNMVALFGETKACEWGPIGVGKYSIQSPDSDINHITVEKVFEISKQILKS